MENSQISYLKYNVRTENKIEFKHGSIYRDELQNINIRMNIQNGEVKYQLFTF